MKIDSLNFNNQRNAAHCQYQKDFMDLTIQTTPQVLGIVDEFEAYEPLVHDETIALNAITKSAKTDEVVTLDKVRDKTLRGTIDAASNSLNHFDASVSEAGRVVMVIIDSYGNLVPKPYDEETGLITSMISDLRTKTAQEIITIGLVPWINKLEVQNNDFNTTQKSRNSEEANRTELRMKQVRVTVDAANRKIVERINALIIVNGEAAYSEFVKELNVRIGRASDAIAQSKVHPAKTDAPKA